MKPDNILIDKNFDVKIADFGFSCELNTNKLTNFKSGTTGYMLPEQFREEPYNGRDADLFASAVVLFMMLTGCMPFNAAKEDDEYYKFIVKGKFEKFWSIYKDAAPNISQEAKELLYTMFEKDPASRLTLEELKVHPWVTD